MKNLFIVTVLSFISLSLYAQQTDQSKELEMFMEMSKKYGQPGPEHKLLDEGIGSWKAVTKMYGMAGNVLCTCEATAERKWIMGGRFVQEEFKDGSGFEGLSFMGYDNIKKQYVVLWMDNMGTGLYLSEGNYDEKNKVFTMLSAEYVCPIAGKKVRNKGISRTLSDKEHLFEMYTVDCETQKEFKCMEILYTRKP